MVVVVAEAAVAVDGVEEITSAVVMFVIHEIATVAEEEEDIVVAAEATVEEVTAAEVTVTVEEILVRGLGNCLWHH